MQTRRNPIEDKPDTQLTWNLGITKHIDLPPEINYKNASVIDPAFDADDKLDIHKMFRQFNERFFSDTIKGYTLCQTKAKKGDYEQTEFDTKKIILCGALTGQPRSLFVKTLIHEMAHADLDVRGVCSMDNGGHQTILKKETRRVSKLDGCNIKSANDVDRTLIAAARYTFQCRRRVIKTINSNPGPNQRYPGRRRHEASWRGHFRLRR